MKPMRTTLERQNEHGVTNCKYPQSAIEKCLHAIRNRTIEK